jgi:hypothetical protein
MNSRTKKIGWVPSVTAPAHAKTSIMINVRGTRTRLARGPNRGHGTSASAAPITTSAAPSTTNRARGRDASSTEIAFAAASSPETTYITATGLIAGGVRVHLDIQGDVKGSAP